MGLFGNRHSDTVRQELGIYHSEGVDSFSGSDITIFAVLPYSKNNITERRMAISGRKGFKRFAEIQTISVSSTRSVHPIRVLGQSNPRVYSRGARTCAGTMVFAAIDKDALLDLYVPFEGESFVNHDSFLIDQIPPFTIVITMGNERGQYGVQFIKGVSIVNYGTTYSINDLYTEQTYSYIATEISPLLSTSLSTARSILVDNLLDTNDFFNSVSDIDIPGRRRPTAAPDDIVDTDDPVDLSEVSTLPEPPQEPSSIQEAVLERTIDGDTIVVSVDGKEESVRLLMIDSPEATTIVEKWGPEATAFTRGFLAESRGNLYIERDVTNRDSYRTNRSPGRLLRYVWVGVPGEPGSLLLNEELARAGLGEVQTAFPNERHYERIRQAQVEAQGDGRGIWGSD
jgi:endonuclease YncB( thermonuclease family)